MVKNGIFDNFVKNDQVLVGRSKRVGNFWPFLPELAKMAKMVILTKVKNDHFWPNLVILTFLVIFKNGQKWAFLTSNFLAEIWVVGSLRGFQGSILTQKWGQNGTGVHFTVGLLVASFRRKLCKITDFRKSENFKIIRLTTHYPWL